MHCQARSSPILNNVTKMHAILHLCNSPTLYTSEITQYTIPLAVSHERIQPHVLLAPPRQERAASQQDFAWLYLDSLVCTISYCVWQLALTGLLWVSHQACVGQHVSDSATLALDGSPHFCTFQKFYFGYLVGVHHLNYTYSELGPHVQRYDAGIYAYYKCR